MSESAQVPFNEAKNKEMTFGKYRGNTIDEIATDDEGLRYLDWLYGEMSKDTQKGEKAHFFDALKTYMEDPSIKREVEALRDDRK